MEQRFICPITGRLISITIDQQFVSFSFIYKNNHDEFYDFLKENWKDTFKEHMAQKSWFTSEMADFITSNIQPW